MTRQYSKMTANSFETIARLIEQDKSMKEIMEIVNLSKSSVCRAVKKIQESKTDFINSLKNKMPRKVSSEVETRQQFIKNTVEDLLNSNRFFLNYIF